MARRAAGGLARPARRPDGRGLAGDGAHALERFEWPARPALVVGNERAGLPDDVLGQLDDVVEIPVWGLPYSYNVATATGMALYEYCRQYPRG